MQKSRQIEAIYPLSPMQQGMLFHTIYAPNSGVYFHQVKCVLEGELDASGLREAWQRVLDRHAILRTAFVWEHRKQPLQVVHPQAPLAWSEEDWRGVSPAVQKERLKAYLERDRESGFVLTHAPLMRCALLRTGDHVYEFIWSYHHILLDGWSLALLLKEVFAYYAAFQKHEPLELPRPRPFQDYISWLKRQNLAKAESFWRNSLRGFNAPTPLALARPQSISNGDGKDHKELQLELSSETTAALNKLAAEQQLTLNTVAQGAWALLLSRYSGEADVVYGASVSGRPAELAGIENMIGLFINTLPVRVKISGEELLPDWLKGIQAHQVESRQYEYSPLIQVQGWSEVPRKLPLFESLYIFENYLVESLGMEDFGNLRVRDIDAIAKTNYPLTLTVYQGETLLLKLLYDSSRFDSVVASRMLDHLRTVLENMTGDLRRRVSDIDLLTPAERERLISRSDEANDPQTCLHRLFESQVEQTPLAPALVFEQATLSYAELNSRANQLAHYLRSLGVGPEVVVGVCLPRSVGMVVALLGILKAGGAYLPLDPAYPSQRLSFMVRDSKMRVLLTEPGLWETPAAETVQVVHLNEQWNQIAKEKTENPTSEISVDNLAYVIYTSGSTGTPKGVQIPHAAVANLLLSMGRQPGLDTTDSLLAVTTLSFDIAALEIFLPLIQGARLVLASREVAADAEQLSSALDRYHVTAMQATPATWRMLIESGWQGHAGLKVLCGGEALSAALAKQLLDRSPEVWNVYGPTETTIWSAIWCVNRQGNVLIGKPIARTQLYVLDEHARLVPEGVTGELYIGGLGLARGYRERADLTAEKFVPNPFSDLAGARMYRTGDLARRLPSGEIEYIARVDNQVKVRGFRIELGEIQAALEAHPLIGEAVVTVREDAGGDKRLVAYAVARQRSDAGIVPQLRAHLGELLPDYMLPSAYMMMERLPLTANGKVDRKALPAPDDARPELTQAYVAPRTLTEELIVGIWEEVLGLERAGIDDDFFHLGGHSLLAMQVISRLRDAFKLELPLRLVFSKPTVRVLAQSVEEEFQTGQTLAAPPIEVLPREENLPLSFSQQRLWFLDQMEPGNPFYNLGGAVRLSGPLHVPALRQSLDEVLRRHEVLRTTFAGTGEEVRQVVASAAKLQLPVIDLSHLAPDRRETEIRRLAVSEAQLPFDLTRGPLLRASLLRLTEAEHVVLFTMHHIVGDEWSSGLLIKEIGVLYEAFHHGKPSPLPELKIQYADYAGWQQRWLREEVMETLQTYWRKQLNGAPLVLDLPADGPRPPVQSYQGATYEFELGADLTDKLKSLSRQQGATLFMTLLAGFQALLYRYTGQSDFVIGTPVANRGRQEVEPLIGFFVNLLVLRSEVTAQMTFADHLKRVRETALDAYAHQDFPFEKLVEDLQPERDLSRSPVFQVLFSLQNAPTDVLATDLAGLELSLMAIERGISRYDLGVSVMETNETLSVAFEYNTQLFAASRMKRLAQHYIKLLESIVAEPQQRLGQLELIGEKERHLLLSKWNQTALSYSWESCVHELVEQQAESRPTALALTYEDAELTFDELNQRANRLAHYLRRLGVGREVMVGICVERSLDWVVALLAILKAGGAYVALDPSYPAERLSYMLQDSDVPVLITEERLKQVLASTRAQLICLDTDRDRFAEESDLNPESRAHGGNLAYVTYTSGSTGRPKAVMTTHGSLLNLVFWHRRCFEVTAHDRSPQLAQMGFDASVWELWTYLTAGASVHLIDQDTRLSPARLREWFVEKEITIGWLPPVLAETVLDNNWPEQVRLRLLITGSDKARRHPPATLPFDYVNSYGPTEATVIVTWGAVPLKPNSDSAPLIGRPIDNTQIYILDKQLRPVPIGIPGELCIGGISLGRGYLNGPDLTAEKFVPDAFGPVPGMRLYHTGDLARFHEDGNIEFLGRIDDQVKVRGFRIELGEIETVLAEHPDVRTALIVVNEDSSDDKRLIAYVVPQPQSADGETNYSYELTSRWAQYLREKLPAYMVPSAFVLLKEMPLSPNGKLNRHLLPAPDESGLSKTYVAPRTPVEQTLADIFKEVLNVESTGVYDNFFELGGHSLLATQVLSRVRAVLNVEVPVRSLFETPTVAGLAALISTKLSPTPEAEPIKHASSLNLRPLSFAQQRLWILNQLESETWAYHLPLAVRLTGRLDVQALERTLREIVRRHEALRTTFSVVDNTPMQVISAPSDVPLTLINVSALAGHMRENKARLLMDREIRRPFDLARGPLLRAVLIKLSEQEHIALLTMHHIISDGWSQGVLVHEVETLYEAYARGAESPLAELPIQYADYAVWQREWLRGAVLEEQMGYWRDQLAGSSGVLELPVDHTRPAVRSYRGANRTMRLSEELTRRLQALSQSEGVTLFMTLLSSWQTLLARYSGQWDFNIGTPIASRTRAEVEGLIGFFVNTLVLRTQMNPAASFREQLQQVREVCLGAYAHQDVPFEMLVEELQPERDLSRTPLFQVMFVLQNAPLGELEMPGLKLERLEGSEGNTTKFDLTLTTMETETGLLCWCDYSTALFEGATIARMLEHWRVLLEAIVADPEQSLSALPLLTEAEQEQLLQWGEVVAPYPSERTIGELVAEQAARTPLAVAVEHDNARLSYAELNRRANQLAHYLRRLGVGPEVRVGLCMERSLELVLGLLGILKAGGAYVPLDREYPLERLRFMIDDAQLSVVLMNGPVPPAFAETGVQLIDLTDAAEQIGGESEAEPESGVASGNLAYVIYTSGSTGIPKGVEVDHRAVLRLVLNTDYVQLLPTDRVAQAANTSFDASTFEVWGALLNGATSVVLDKGLILAREGFAAALEARKINALYLTAAMFSQMVQVNPAVFASLRAVLFGGEAVDPRWVREVLQGGPPERVLHMYGPTEVTTFSTWKMVTEVPPDALTVSIGRSIANTETYVLDENLGLLPVGVNGELYHGGDGLARDYLNRPEVTAERFVPHPYARRPGARLYRTGDVVRYRADGEIEFIGRRDAQVKLRGYRIELGEIETVLTQHEQVHDAVLVVREPKPGNKQLVAYVVGEATPAELRAYLKEKLPDYMVPQMLVKLEQLPLTGNGKVDRKALPAPERAGDEAENYVAPRTPEEELLAAIWTEVLGVERVSVHDNFFELGGHSLLATQAVSRIREQFKVELPLRTIFTATVADLAEIIESNPGAQSLAQGPQINSISRLRSLPLSFAQQGLWLTDQLEPGSSAYNVPLAVRFSGSLNVDVFRRTLSEIVRRHEVLRTTFVEVDGEPQQIIAPPSEVSLPLVDLRGLRAAEQQAAVQRHVDEAAEQRFDLATGPLMTGELLKLADDEHVLILTMHHIITDGWSMGVLIYEVGELYKAFAAGRESPLPELPIQYADYAIWQRQRLQGEVLDELLDYWREQLAGAPPLELAPDHPRTTTETFRTANLLFSLTPELTAALKEISWREGATLFMTLLAAWQLLLARYTGQEDIVVGSAIANRTHAGVEGLMGLFVNLLVLRTHVSGELTFLELIVRVREVCLGAYAHQDLPFEWLVEELRPERQQVTRAPLFQVLFQLQNMPQKELQLPGLELSGLPSVFGDAKVDLTLTLFEAENQLFGEFIYDQNLFSETIPRMERQYRTLLESIVENPESPISALALDTEQECGLLIDSFNEPLEV